MRVAELFIFALYARRAEREGTLTDGTRNYDGLDPIMENTKKKVQRIIRMIHDKNSRAQATTWLAIYELVRLDASHAVLVISSLGRV